MDPKGRIALVTGAASGIGRASARLLAARGATVVLADLDRAAGEEAAAEIESRGGRARFLQLDVSSADQLERAFATVVEEHGGLHVLHNNAGLVAGQPDFPETAAARIATVVAVNVGGTFVATRLAIEAIARSGGGAIVNMSSTLALATETADPVYAATKAAVKRFTELSAPIAEARGVRVNAVLPGGVDTPILAKTGGGAGPADWLAPRLEQIQLLAPEQIAATVLALIEDERRNGETVVVRNRPRRGPGR